MHEIKRIRQQKKLTKHRRRKISARRWSWKMTVRVFGKNLNLKYSILDLGFYGALSTKAFIALTEFAGGLLMILLNHDGLLQLIRQIRWWASWQWATNTCCVVWFDFCVGRWHKESLLLRGWYRLSPRILQINGKDLILEEGDSIYFDSSLPHGMKALDGKRVKFIAVVL